ncbi:hypothetical protein CUMW_228300, partial [Citrus unshiu]
TNVNKKGIFSAPEGFVYLPLHRIPELATVPTLYNTANGALPRVARERKSNPNSADARPISSHLKPDSQNQSSTLEPKTVQHNVVKYMVANANSHAFGYVPQVVREQRKKENCLLIRNQGQIHEGEQKKRSNQIESARG